LILIAALWVGFGLPVHADPLRIVVAGDGRAEYPWGPHRACDKEGINEFVTKAIANAVLNEKAAILLWTGDMVNVNSADTDALKNGLERWRNIMEPLYSQKVKVWPVRGNHEVYKYLDKDNRDGELIPDAVATWRSVFSGPYALPGNAPEGEEDLSFYSIEGPALIVGLDQYRGADADPLRRKHSVNQTWLDRVLSQNQKTFTFVYGHEAAFMAGRHTDDDTLAADASGRNLFWQSLVKVGATYFCGHDHFYDRMKVARNGPTPGRELFQITAGTAGAPAYDIKPYAGSALWKVERANKFDHVWGYVLIEVEKEKATISFKGTAVTNCDERCPLSFAKLDEIVCRPSGCETAP
jgi:hypothetical protein